MPREEEVGWSDEVGVEGGNIIACYCVLILAPTQIEVSFNVLKTASKSIIFQLDYQKEQLISPT